MNNIINHIKENISEDSIREGITEPLSPEADRIVSRMLSIFIYSIGGNPYISAKDVPVVKEFLLLSVRIVTHFPESRYTLKALVTLNGSVLLGKRLDGLVEGERVSESIASVIKERHFVERLQGYIRAVGAPLSPVDIHIILSFLRNVPACDAQALLESNSEVFVRSFTAVATPDKFESLAEDMVNMNALLHCKEKPVLFAMWRAISVHILEMLLSVSSFDHKLQSIKVLGVLSEDEFIARWVRENRALMGILRDVSVHVEFVKRSEPVIRNLAKAGQLDKEMVGRILTFCSNDAPKDVREAMLGIITGAAPHMPQDTLRAFDAAFAAFPAEAFFEASISCVVVQIIRQCILSSPHKVDSMCMKRLLEGVMDKENEMAVENGEGAEEDDKKHVNEMVVENNENNEINEINEINRNIENIERIICMLTMVFMNFDPPVAIKPYLDEYIDNIRRHKSSWQSCLIASRIVGHNKAFQDYQTASEFFDLTVQDMDHFKNVVARPYAAAIRGNPGGFVIPGTRTTYRMQVKYRLEALGVIKISNPMQNQCGTFTLPLLKLSTAQVRRLWDVFVQGPIDPAEQETFISFLNGVVNENYAAFSEETFRMLLSEKVAQLDFGTLTAAEVDFISYLIKCVNTSSKTFVNVNENWIIPDHTKFLGIDIIWKIVLEAGDDAVAHKGADFFQYILQYIPDSSCATRIVGEAFRELRARDASKAHRLLEIMEVTLAKINPQDAQARSGVLSAIGSYDAFYGVLNSGAAWDTKALCAHVLHRLPFDRQLEAHVREMLGKNGGMGSGWGAVFGPEKGYFFIKYALSALDSIAPAEEALLESGLAAYLAAEVLPRYVDAGEPRYLDLCATLVKLFSTHSATVLRALPSEEARRAYVRKLFGLVRLCVQSQSPDAAPAAKECLGWCVKAIGSVFPDEPSASMEVEGEAAPSEASEARRDASFLFVDGCVDEAWLRDTLVRRASEECYDVLGAFAGVFGCICDPAAKERLLGTFLSITTSLCGNPRLSTHALSVGLSTFFIAFTRFLVKQRFACPTLECVLSAVGGLLEEQMRAPGAASPCPNDVNELCSKLVFVAYKVSTELARHAREEVRDEWAATEQRVVDAVLRVYLFGEPAPVAQSPRLRSAGFTALRGFAELWAARGGEQDVRRIRSALGAIAEQARLVGLCEETHYRVMRPLKTAFPRYAGIKNLGSTCYVNSVLQQLYMIPALREAVLGLDLSGGLAGGFLSALQRMFSQMQDGCRASVTTEGLIKTIKINGDTIQPRVQMDAMEFFEAVIDKASDEAKRAPGGRDFVQDVFGFKMCSQLIPRTCPHTSESACPSTSTSVEVKGKTGLLASLDDWVQGEMLVGDNKYRCETCGEKHDTLKRACFLTTPNVLAIHCKRFDFDYNTLERIKIDTYFEFPMTFSIYPYTKEGVEHPGPAPQEARVRGDYQYDLVGVVVHYGSTEFGHYYSFIKDRDGGGGDGWVKFNDEELSSFPPSDIPKECYGRKPYSAYMLFYQKRSYTAAAAATASPTRSEILAEINEENKFLTKAAALFDSGFTRTVEELFLKDNAPLASFMDLDHIIDHFTCIIPYLEGSNGIGNSNNANPSAPKEASPLYDLALWQPTLEAACRSDPAFLGDLFTSGKALLVYALCRITDQNVRAAFASIVATKIAASPTAAARADAIAGLVSVIDTDMKGLWFLLELFLAFELVARSGADAAAALLDAHAFTRATGLMFPQDKAAEKTAKAQHYDMSSGGLAEAIIAVFDAVKNDPQAVSRAVAEATARVELYKPLGCFYPETAARLLNLIASHVSGEASSKQPVSCLVSAALFVEYEKLDEFFAAVGPFFAHNGDGFASLRVDHFMREFVDIEENYAKQKDKKAYMALLNAVAARIVDPREFPLVTDWLLQNLPLWFPSFIKAPTTPEGRDAGLMLLFRAVGCDEEALAKSSEPLDEARAARLRRVLRFVLGAFAELTGGKITIPAKYLQISRVLVACMRPEVYEAGMVSKEHVDALLDFVGRMNARKDTLWVNNPKYLIAEFILAAAAARTPDIPDGEAIAGYVASSKNLEDSLCFVKSGDTLTAGSPKDADRPVKAMCALAHLVLSRSPGALASFFPGSETFGWLLSTVLFAESGLTAPGARTAVEGLVSAMLVVETAGLGAAVARRLASVFTSLRTTPFEDASKAIENTVFAPPQGGTMPASSISAFCGGGALEFVRERLCSPDDVFGKVMDFALLLFSVISSREDKSECVQKDDACKAAVTNLALDVFFLCRPDPDGKWSFLAQLIPDRRSFVEALWRRLVGELPQRRGDNPHNDFADDIIKEEAKRGEGEGSVRASLVLLYISVFLDPVGSSASPVEELATPLLARTFVSEIFNSSAISREKPADHAVNAMKRLVAVIPDRRELALSFAEALRGRAPETVDGKKAWMRRVEMLLEYFEEDVPKEVLQELMSTV